MYLNKIILIGNITREVELKATAGGMKVATFSLATNRVWKEKDGTRKEAADYHNIVVWGKQAESVATYMKKGSQVLIEGRIQTRSWDDKDTGKKIYRTEVIAENVQFGNKPLEQKEKSVIEDTEIDYPVDEDLNNEDIPF